MFLENSKMMRAESDRDACPQFVGWCRMVFFVFNDCQIKRLLTPVGIHGNYGVQCASMSFCPVIQPVPMLKRRRKICTMVWISTQDTHALITSRRSWCTVHFIGLFRANLTEPHPMTRGSGWDTLRGWFFVGAWVWHISAPPSYPFLSKYIMFFVETNLMGSCASIDVTCGGAPNAHSASFLALLDYNFNLKW